MQPHRYHIDEKETDYGPVELNDYGNSHVSQLHYQRQEYGDPNVNDLLDWDVLRLRPLENAEEALSLNYAKTYLAIRRNYGNAEYKWIK